MAESEVLRAPHVLEFPYKRSLGPVIGAFLTGLRDGQILGARTQVGGWSFRLPSTTPRPAEDVEPELVEVGPGGVRHELGVDRRTRGRTSPSTARSPGRSSSSTVPTLRCCTLLDAGSADELLRPGCG